MCDVHDDCIKIMSWWIHYSYIQYEWMRCWSALDEIVYWLVFNLICIISCYWNHWKVLLDRDTLYNPIVHRIHGYCYCSLLLLLFTMYTITVYWYTISLLSLYRPSILVIWMLIIITKLNNNINRQLTLGMRELMEETASVFWVDLGYRLRRRDTVPLQDSRGSLTSRIVHIVIVIDILLLLLTI